MRKSSAMGVGATWRARAFEAIAEVAYAQRVDQRVVAALTEEIVAWEMAESSDPEPAELTL